MGTLLTIAAIIYVLYLISNALRSTRRRSTASTLPPPSYYQDALPARQRHLRIKKKPRADIDLASIEINDDYKSVLDLIEVQNKSIYVTGNAGTGKSTLLKYLISTTKKNMIVLAPTGLAAINVGGQTIHSFFRFPPKLIKKENIKPSRNAILYQKLDAVIIDEVSMVRADVMDGIDQSLRINRGKLHEPFGGVQMIFFGDLFQLPPIVKGRDLEDFFNEVYGAPYFFCSKAIKSSRISFVDLKKIYRQTETDFIGILNSIRENRLTPDLLQALNSKVAANIESVARKDYVTLTTTNQAAYEINEEFLQAIKEKEYEYAATIQGKFDESDYPTEATLRLKKGARIMLLRNDPLKKWVNGTLARVSNLGEGRISIDVEGSKYEINKETWKKIEYYYDRETRKIEEREIGSFEQYPIRLAWAITIHKSQGQTFDRVYIDLGRGAFAHGQTYVALSRCTSFNGLRLRRPVESRDVIFDSRVYDYAKVMTHHKKNSTANINQRVHSDAPKGGA